MLLAAGGSGQADAEYRQRHQGMNDTVGGRRVQSQFKEAAGKTQPAAAEGEHEEWNDILLGKAVLRPQPAVTVAAVGNVEQQEAAEVKDVIKIAALAEADAEHGVVGNQGQQEAIEQAVAVVVLALQRFGVMFVEQAQGHQQRVGRLDPQIYVIDARRQQEIEDITEAGVRVLQAGFPVAGPPALQQFMAVQVIDVDAVQPGDLQLQAALGREAAGVVDLKMDPDRRCANTEFGHGRRCRLERAHALHPASFVDIQNDAVFRHHAQPAPQCVVGQVDQIRRRSPCHHGKCQQ